VNETTPTPGAEPGAVVLDPRAVAALRKYLARASDWDATADERADPRIALCGYLGACLDVEVSDR
jgi:hypothetical protein